jgi:diguanylate cyclase (GGDEF)-like protein/PAS domain S-box-containing protein
MTLDHFRSRFEASSVSRTKRVGEQIEHSFSIVKVLARYIERCNDPNRDTFDMLSLPLWQSHTDLDGLAWIPSPEKKLPGNEGHRAVYVQPRSMESHLESLSGPSLFSAIERCRRRGKQTAAWHNTGGTGRDSVLLLLAPVYQTATTAGTIERRRRSFRGVVLGILHPDKALQPFTEDESQFLVEAVKLKPPQKEHLLYRHTAATKPTDGSALDVLLPAWPSLYLKMTTGGEEWFVKAAPGQGYLRRYFGLSYWLFLPGGLLVTLLLTLLLHSYASYGAKMEMTVKERTAKLREHEQHLEDLIKERTQSLEWKSAFLEALADSSSDGILVFDSHGKRVFQNERTVEVWKMPRDIVDKDDERLTTDYCASMIKDPEEFLKKADYLFDHPDECARDEISLIDGRVLDRFSSPVYGKDGTYYGRIWTFHDVTELKAAEETRIGTRFQLRDALDLARIAYWEANPETMEYTFNDPFYELFATTAAREGGYQMSFREYAERFIHPDDLERAKKSMANREDLSFVELEHRAVRRDGQVIHILTHARDARDSSGRVVRIYGANQDITDRKIAEQAVLESESKFRALAEKSKVGIYLVQDGKFKYVNARFAEIHGYRPEELIDKKGVEDVILADDSSVFEKAEDNRGWSTSSDGFQLAFRVLTKQGEIRDVEIYGSRTTYLGKSAMIGTLVDITERKKTEEMVRWKTAFLEAQVNSSLDGILVVDSAGKTILQNQRTIDIWKIPRSIIDRKDDREQLRHVVSMAKQPEKFKARILGLYGHPEETGRDEIELKDGTVLDCYSCPVRGESNRYYGRIWMFRDITELRHYWDMLESLSTTDGLTELPNRRRFDEFINREWRRAMRDQSVISLILMDIDFFKEFNDHYGHLAGDDCLRQVAKVLRETVYRPGDLAARYGGEEFACVLPETDSAGAITLANRIRKRIEEMGVPHFFSKVADHVTISIGVASQVPGRGETPSCLIQLADELLYSAKEGGRDQVKSWHQPTRGRRASNGP